MQVRFETEQAVGYFILVPEEATDFNVMMVTRPCISYKVKNNHIHYPLPQAGFTHLGTLGKLTEEQAAVIVEFTNKPIYIGRHYRDYKIHQLNFTEKHSLITAIDSLQSLADSLEVYSVNPLERPVDEDGYVLDNIMMKEWQAA